MFPWRPLLGPAIAATAIVLLQPQAARAEPGVPVPPNALLSNTGEGEITPADKDFVTKVRLAGLWEIPAGEMAQERSNDPRIQDIGGNIASQHEALDLLTRTAAKKLKIGLPDKPNSDQQRWLGEMRAAKSGSTFDRIYIDRLRAAHGKIFPAIATIRASTRNDTVRRLAQQANQFVMTHMTLLESSGIVDFQALPTAPNPSASTTPPKNTRQLVPSADTRPLSGRSPLLLVLLVAGLGLAALASRQMIMRNASRPRRRHRPR